MYYCIETGNGEISVPSILCVLVFKMELYAEDLFAVRIAAKRYSFSCF